MNPPQVYMCSHPEPSSLLPPHTIPLGRPSAPAPSIQYRASNLDWQLVSYMIFTTLSPWNVNSGWTREFYKYDEAFCGTPKFV